MTYPTINKRLIECMELDIAFRETLLSSDRKNEGYNEEMQQIHERNARILGEIIEGIGYPTTDKVGEDGAYAAWLIIQHAISLPHFMINCAQLLKKAVEEGKANPIHLAYLVDRIAVFQNKPQQYGTQFDWDVEGKMSPQEIDDVDAVNERRAALGLLSIEEQTTKMRTEAQSEQRNAPADFFKRKKDFYTWQKKHGWID